MGQPSNDPEQTAAELFLPSLVTDQTLARHLDIPRDDARSLFEGGAFPARKIAGKWVATKAAILLWLSEEQGQ